MEDTDLFLVNRNDTTYTQTADELMANLKDTDYLLVNRDNTTYKITGAEFKDSVEPDTGSIVTGATVVASSEYPPSTLTATQPVVINATQDLSYDNWYKDGVAIAGTTEQLVYTATSPGTYKYEERWVDNAGNELKPNATVTIKQSEVAKPTVIAPADGAGQGVDITYYPETSAIDSVGTTTLPSAFPAPDGTSSSYWGVAYGQPDDSDKPMYVAVASDTGRALYSYDGRNWNIASSPTNVGWRSVCFGNGKFVAVGSSGAGTRAMYTTSGDAWTAATSGVTSNSWQDVAYGDGRFVAVADSGSFATMNSMDGKSWTAVSSTNDSNGWYSITFSEQFNRFVAVGHSGSGRSMYSNSGGQSWSAGSGGANSNWRSVAVGKDLPSGGSTRFVAISIAQTDTDALMYSTNGLSWEAQSISIPMPGIWGLAYGNGVWVAVSNEGTGGQKIAYSETGIGGWTLTGPNDGLSGWRDVTFGGGQFVAVGDEGTNRIAVSTDGINWTGEERTVLTLTDDKAYNSSDDSEVTTIDEAFTEGTVVSGEGGSAPDTAAFGVATYLGDGNSNKVVETGVNNTGKSLVWVKGTTVAYDHILKDTVTNIALESNTPYQGNVSDAKIKEFLANGFTTGNSAQTNTSGTYVAWNFRAAPGFFDVVAYEGSDPSTEDIKIPHSLGTKPGMIIIKRTTNTGDWVVYHQEVGATAALFLSETNGPTTSSGYFNNTEPTSTEFTVANLGQSSVNSAGDSYVAYLFADTPGKIKCGSYIGNGSGVTVELGFEPEFLLVKDAGEFDVYGWGLFDNKRNEDTNTRRELLANTTAEERVDGGIEFTSTGFVTSNWRHDTNTKYIYVAIAKNVTAGEFPPTGVLAADADTSGPSLTLKDVTGTWSDGMTAVGQTELTQGAPDPTNLEFVGSIPAVANGTINTWGDATWKVTNLSDNSTQTETKAITAGQQQKLSVGNDITLEGGTTYDVTVKYDAPDSVDATSDANTFRTYAPSAADNFSVINYTGNQPDTQFLNTGVDNTSTKAFLWIKDKISANEHILFSSEYGGWLQSNQSNALQGSPLTPTWTPIGAILPSDGGNGFNYVNDYVAWNFASTAGFFDIVTWTADGTGLTRNLPHNLGMPAGFIMAKAIGPDGQDWYCQHNFLDTEQLKLNESVNGNVFLSDGLTSTASTFQVDGGSLNRNGQSYVAFLFADNPDSGIKCGEYTGNSASQSIFCGFKPSWLMIKKFTDDGTFTNWNIFDSQNGLWDAGDGNIKGLYANSNADLNNIGGRRIRATDTGFTFYDESAQDVNTAGKTYIYIAIASNHNTNLFYNVSTKETIRGFEIIAKHGIEPDSAAAKQLGFAELTEQPTYEVGGYELQADGRYKPIRSYAGQLAAAQATITTLQNP